MPPPKKKPTAITVDLPSATFPTVVFANKVGLEWLQGDALIHFGLNAASGLLSSFAIVLEAETISFQRENWADYLASIDEPEGRPDLAFRCSAGTLLSPVGIANVALWSRRQAAAEMRFYTFSHGDAHSASTPGSKQKIHAQSMALVRCHLDLQLTLLGALLLNA